MNEIPSRSAAELPLELLQRVDQVCNRFEAACRAGETPVVDDFLAGWDEPERSVLRRELLALQAHHRQRGRGEQTTPPADQDTAVVEPGRIVGDYELLEEIAGVVQEREEANRQFTEAAMGPRGGRGRQRALARSITPHQPHPL